MDRSLNPFHPTRQYTGGGRSADTSRLDRKVQIINCSQNDELLATHDTTSLDRVHSAPRSTGSQSATNIDQSQSQSQQQQQQQQGDDNDDPRKNNHQRENASHGINRINHDSQKPIMASSNNNNNNNNQNYYGSMDGSDCGQTDRYFAEHAHEALPTHIMKMPQSDNKNNNNTTRQQKQ